jgi:hypothetical protein
VRYDLLGDRALGRRLVADLVAVNRLVEDAKASVVGFTPNGELLADDSVLSE